MQFLFSHLVEVFLGWNMNMPVCFFILHIFCFNFHVYRYVCKSTTSRITFGGLNIFSSLMLPPGIIMHTISYPTVNLFVFFLPVLRNKWVYDMFLVCGLPSHFVITWPIYQAAFVYFVFNFGSSLSVTFDLLGSLSLFFPQNQFCKVQYCATVQQRDCWYVSFSTDGPCIMFCLSLFCPFNLDEQYTLR